MLPNRSLSMCANQLFHIRLSTSNLRCPARKHTWPFALLDLYPSVAASSSVLLFADDTKCFKTIKSPSDRPSLQSDLNSLAAWSQQWNVCFNESKCNVVSFHPKNKPAVANYSINSKALAVRSSHKDLGILMSDTLSWADHYHLISSS